MITTVCVQCEVAYTLDSMGVWVVAFSKDGVANNVYRADRYKCPLCNQVIITDFGNGLKAMDKYENDPVAFQELLNLVMQEDNYFMRDR